MLISKTIEIDMGHRLPNHNGRCRNLHGHRYKIEAGIEGRLIESGSSEGMVIDFADIKDILVSINEKLDHGCMLYYGDPLVKILPKDLKIIVVDFMPTAENIAKYLYDGLLPQFQRINVHLQYIKVFETPTTMALYQNENRRTI